MAIVYGLIFYLSNLDITGLTLMLCMPDPTWLINR